MDKIANILGAIIMLALVATVLASPNTGRDVTALGSAFSNSIKAATGRR